MGGIYKIESIKTGRVYIGSAININHRWKRHKTDLKCGRHHSKFMQRHHDKYGMGDLEFIIVELCEDDVLIEREQYYIDDIICEFNSAKIAGSCKGVKHSDEANRKKSLANKGKGNPTYGLERTPEWRKKISEANKGQIPWNKGVGHSDEAKEKMTNVALNREKVICEHCTKHISNSNYVRWHGDNCKYKGGNGCKKCNGCDEFKNLTEFNQDNKFSDGYNNKCRVCWNNYARKQYKKRHKL